jgi:hypothetical protein
MMQQGAGMALLALVPVASTWQVQTGGVLEKLGEQWPLIAVFFVALYLLFSAYQKLADRISEKLIDALNKNTAAFTEQASANKRVADVVEKVDQRLDGIEYRLNNLERDRK